MCRVDTNAVCCLDGAVDARFRKVLRVRMVVMRGVENAPRRWNAMHRQVARCE